MDNQICPLTFPGNDKYIEELNNVIKRVMKNKIQKIQKLVALLSGNFLVGLGGRQL